MDSATFARTVAFNRHGDPLTTNDVADMRARAEERQTGRPAMRVPRYDTGGHLFTRDELLVRFREPWNGYHVNDDDVNAYLWVHFNDGRAPGHIVPTSMVPFPPMASVDEDVDDRTRERIIRDYEEKRISSRRARELFDIDGLPMFVPSLAVPTDGDESHIARAKAQYINSL